MRAALRILVTAREHMTTDRTATINALAALLRMVELGIDARKPLTDKQVSEVARRRARVHLDGTELAKMPARKLARQLGLLPQQPIAPDGITVADVVGRGRHPHQRWFRQWSTEDEEAVTAAMAATGVDQLAESPIDERSGGQRQRVWIALALAQDPEIMLLDEPTTYLDLAHQLDVLNLLASLNRRLGRTIVLVLHDLNMASRYPDHLVAMREGSLVAQGTPGPDRHRHRRARGLRRRGDSHHRPRRRHPADPAPPRRRDRDTPMTAPRILGVESRLHA